MKYYSIEQALKEKDTIHNLKQCERASGKIYCWLKYEKILKKGQKT